MFTQRFTLWALTLFAVLGLPHFEVHAASPDFAGLSAISDNANNTWAKSGDTITFTLNLNVAEDSDGSGAVTFDIGALTGQTAPFVATGAATAHTATYNV